MSILTEFDSNLLKVFPKIRDSNQLKFLGMTIDGKLNFSEHIKADLHGTILSHTPHFLGHNCRKVLKRVLKPYNFFRVVSVS